MPRDNATEMDETQLVSTVQQLKDRLVVLTKQLNELETSKKTFDKKINGDIKDVKYEMQEVLALMKEQEASNE